ncbi:MAG: hypothetical protein RMK30_07195 [Anaerolineae bacterium]|nr:hypothetical protein [Anaerolineae bacterium]MDW8102644.1 hypothetical protein [Anaerolineae bacterium]
MFKAKNLLLVVAVLALAIAACRPGPAATPEPSLPLKETPQFTPTPTPTEEPLEVENFYHGLEKFSSYRIHWYVTFDGKDSSGSPVKWETHWLEEYTANPPARRLTFKSSEVKGTLVVVQLKDKTYYIAEGNCFTTATAETDFLSRFTPEFGISGGTFVGYETVAGVRAKRYTFDEKAFTWGGFVKVRGEVWVAPEGYVLKETLEASGRDVFYEKGEGTLRWTWEVTDLNSPFTIEVPPECAQLQPEDIPILADASDMMTMEGFISYKSAASFQEAVKFYKEKMPANGWAPAEGSLEMENMVMLNFEKGDRTASVTIHAEEEGVSVMITFRQ